ncbi:MAG: hypothetical protein H6607_10720 [Flavobacteriales bacterium]|nr:hypothetical protein [Flavobacteriales bacterium]
MKENNHLEQLSEIRSMMERSTRFISLSGLSGVMAGLYALAGAYMAHRRITNSENYQEYIKSYSTIYEGRINQDIIFFVLLGLVVMFFSFVTGYVLTKRRADKNNQKMFDKIARRLLINMMIPLATGGVLCAIFLYHGYWGLVAPLTLIFYGLALINGSKYSLETIRFLGIFEVCIGLISAFDIGHGLYYWALGFGVLHIVYGIYMWWRFERK